MYLFFVGISGKSQILFALVFTTRYLDLFTSFVSIYNTCMKVFFITASYFTLFLMYHKFKATYDSNHDTFRIEFLVVPVGGLSFLVNHEFAPLEVWFCDIMLLAYIVFPFWISEKQICAFGLTLQLQLLWFSICALKINTKWIHGNVSYQCMLQSIVISL